VDVAFRKSFEKDLGKLRDEALLEKIKAEIEVVENAETLQDVSNLKKLKKATTTASELETTESV
jgi:mRNA interferase RelE/StbE